MATREELLSFIAGFKGVSADTLSLEAPLGLSSLAAQRFRSALKRNYGVDLPEKDFKTLSAGNVLSELDAGAPLVPTIDVSAVKVFRKEPFSSSEFGIGIDMENVTEFRTSVDVQSDPFFLDTFTAPEIGYCLLQEDPAQHFAARFCAKEALRKCSLAYTHLAFNQIQVSHRPNGAPYYEIPHLNRRLNHVSVSMSHTTDMAIAVAACRGSDSEMGGGTISNSMGALETGAAIEPAPETKSTTVTNRKRLPRPSLLIWLVMFILAGESVVRIH